MKDMNALAQYVYNQYLKHEYTDKSNPAAWIYPTEHDIKRDPSLKGKPKVFRPNHGLAHTLRVTANVGPIIEYLKNFGKNPEQFNFSEEEIFKLKLCALFSVVGRDNDTGWAGNPEGYMKFRRQSGERFEKFCRENHIFSSEAELQKYKNHLIDMGEPGNKDPIHVVINMAHKLDLLRTFTVKDDHAKEAVVEYVNEHSALKNNKQMLSLIQYAIDTNEATGNRLWSQLERNERGEYKFDEKGNPIVVETPKSLWHYRYNPFYRCSTDPKFCLEQINSVPTPQFVVNEQKEAQYQGNAKSQFETAAALIKNTQMAVRLLNNNVTNIQDLHYEMEEWVDPVHHRFVRDWWGDSNLVGDRRKYRDQITGKVIERPVQAHLPLEQQKPITENPSLSEYWDIDANGSLVPKARPIDINPEHMGDPKNTKFTKKRSFSLLRPDGKIVRFRGPAQTRDNFFPIGLGCDVEKLHQKGQRYIWWDDTRSSQKFWLGKGTEGDPTSPKYPGRNKGVFLKTLQDKYNEMAKEGAPPDWYNEMMMGGTLEALRMVYAPDNTLGSRLNLLFSGLRLKHDYHIDLPHVILDGYNAPGIYTKEQMYADLLYVASGQPGVTEEDQACFDKLVHSVTNAYRWENELSSLVDLNNPEVTTMLKTLSFDGAPLDDVERAKVGKPALSLDHKVAELMKKMPVHKLVTDPKKQTILAKMVSDRLDTVNHKLSPKDYYSIAGLKPATICMPNTDVLSKMPRGALPVHWAVEQKNASALEYLQAMGEDLNSRDHNKNTPLHIAVMKGDLQMAQWLIEHGANIDALNIKGQTPLSCANKKGNRSIGDSRLSTSDANSKAKNTKDFQLWLTTKGFNPKNINQIQKKSGHSPLTWCVACNDFEGVKKLLTDYPTLKVNQKNAHGMNALMLAAKNDQEHIVEHILKYGSADISLKNNTGKTVSELAQGRAKQWLQLKELGANLWDLNAVLPNRGLTPLLQSLKNGNPNLARFLIQKGVDVNATTQGISPLHMVASDRTDNVDLLKVLFEHRDFTPKNINDFDQQNGYTPLMLAARQGNAKMVQYLLEEVNVNANLISPKNKLSAYDIAIQNGHHDIAAQMLNHFMKQNGFNRSNLNLVSTERNACLGHTPLTYALATQQNGLVKKLVEVGADINQANKQKWPVNPLLWVASKSDDNVLALKQVLACSPDINTQDPKWGYSALMYAAYQGYHDIVKYLIEHTKINVDLRSNKGKTALEIAKERGNTEIAHLIEAHQNKKLEKDNVLPRQSSVPERISQRTRNLPLYSRHVEGWMEQLNQARNPVPKRRRKM